MAVEDAHAAAGVGHDEVVLVVGHQMPDGQQHPVFGAVTVPAFHLEASDVVVIDQPVGTAQQDAVVVVSVVVDQRQAVGGFEGQRHGIACQVIAVGVDELEGVGGVEQQLGLAVVDHVDREDLALRGFTQGFLPQDGAVAVNVIHGVGPVEHHQVFVERSLLLHDERFPCQGCVKRHFPADVVFTAFLGLPTDTGIGIDQVFRRGQLEGFLAVVLDFEPGDVGRFKHLLLESAEVLVEVEGATRAVAGDDFLEGLHAGGHHQILVDDGVAAAFHGLELVAEHIGDETAYPEVVKRIALAGLRGHHTLFRCHAVHELDGRRRVVHPAHEHLGLFLAVFVVGNL